MAVWSVFAIGARSGPGSDRVENVGVRVTP